ncbi:uncharacterized protein LOC110930539 isoform X2 [Helianthus annuus]|uniref:uncharacterized protein LOC118482199 isoform X2 n=1 Tax=Helianthus annuus TaxID=4232 RepID=UPI00165331E9|nr:uncharacterized protein LOC118482199 isoform X2 [Helianthus annuus]XP_035840958.1 uncharacterized protein LOC110930539 isoform X2 [Helianthus annuus]
MSTQQLRGSSVFDVQSIFSHLRSSSRRYKFYFIATTSLSRLIPPFVSPVHKSYLTSWPFDSWFSSLKSSSQIEKAKSCTKCYKIDTSSSKESGVKTELNRTLHIPKITSDDILAIIANVTHIESLIGKRTATICSKNVNFQVMN